MTSKTDKSISRRTMLSTLARATAGSQMAWAAPPQQGSSVPCPAAADSVGAAARTPEEKAHDLAVLLNYFSVTAPQLLRPAQGILTHPTIAPSLPGKAYSAELWDWDTYWTARGLFRYAELKKDAAFKAKVGDHARGSLLAFLAQQTPAGRIPIMMTPTNNDRFGSLDPTHNQAKPVMAQLALLICEQTGDAAWLTPVFSKLIAFHDAWISTNMSATGLLVWSNGLAIGNDNDPTTSGRPPMSSANPLLNCLFYEDLRAAADLAQRLGHARTDELTRRADSFGETVRGVLWDERDGFFYSHDVQIADDRLPNSKKGMDFSYKSIPIRIATFTGFLPLWCGLSTPEQAERLLGEHYRRDDRFRAHFGCRTLSAHETMYSLVFSSNPSNWLGPVWTISNYLVWRALQNFGTQAEAQDMADKTLRLLANDISKHGSLNEYYHPDTGEALSHAGFLDWNLLVLEMV